MAYINILNIMYPIGALYFSTENVSPSELIGGSWVELNSNAVVGCGNGYFGSKTIATTNMPAHTHIVKSNYGWGKYIGASNKVNDGAASGYGLAAGGGFTDRCIVNFENYNSNAYGTSSVGGALHTFLTPLVATFGTEWDNLQRGDVLCTLIS